MFIRKGSCTPRQDFIIVYGPAVLFIKMGFACQTIILRNFISIIRLIKNSCCLYSVSIFGAANNEKY